MNLVRKMTILIFVFLLCCPPVGVFAAKVPPLDTSDVMEDLEGLKLGNVAFDEAAYPLDDWTLEGGCKHYVLGIYEYGWGTELYSLYIYVYNPDAGNVDHDYGGTYIGTLWAHSNSVYNPRYSWEIHPEIVDQSEDGRFLKLKVDGSVAAQALNRASKRIYSVGLVTWYTQQSSYAGPDGLYYDITLEAEAGGYGQNYIFTQTGAASYQTGETISLDVYPSMYKMDFSPKGNYWHQMIYTAYFTIPKKYVENYDAMTGIEATWEEYHTAPLVVTEDDALLSVLTAMAEDKALDDKLLMGQINHDYGSILSEYFVITNLITSEIDAFNASDTINAIGLNRNIRGDIFPSDNGDIYGKQHHRFDTVLKVSDMNDFFIPTIGRYYDTDGDGIGDLAATFQNTVDEDRLLGKNTYSFTCKDILSVDKRFDDNWLRNWWNGKWYPDSNDVEATLPPFYYLKDSDMTGYSRTIMNENLFIGERFWGAFYDEYAKAKLTGDQVVLFRFALRDYYSAPARYIDGETYSAYGYTPNCALSYGTAFLDFDIIKLTFSDDAVAYEFNVDADPIDFVPGGDAPNTPGAGIGAAADDLLSKVLSVIETFFKIIVGIVAVVVVVTLIKWLLTWLALRRR